MADFEKAIIKTLEHEGLYSVDPADRGGETYKGIARRMHPNWHGWKVIDSYKGISNFPKNTISDPNLQKLVKSFYKAAFWDVNLLDQVPSQYVAEELFDTGVNMGTSKAAKFLQEALNVLNNCGKLYNDLTVDGKVGANTIKAVKLCIENKGDSYLYKVLNILQGSFYIDLMRKNVSQEKFAYGWLSRVEFKKL